MSDVQFSDLNFNLGGTGITAVEPFVTVLERLTTTKRQKKLAGSRETPRGCLLILQAEKMYNSICRSDTSISRQADQILSMI